VKRKLFPLCEKKKEKRKKRLKSEKEIVLLLQRKWRLEGGK
jgi:hypothetical protein